MRQVYTLGCSVGVATARPKVALYVVIGNVGCMPIFGGGHKAARCSLEEQTQ